MLRRISALLAVAALAITFGPGRRAVATEHSTQAPVNYGIGVLTHNAVGSGTDANVKVKLVGTLGKTGWMALDSGGDDFELGSYDRFLVTAENVGDVTKVCLMVDDAGLFPDWTVHYVDVTYPGPTKKRATFAGRMPVNQQICRRVS